MSDQFLGEIRMFGGNFAPINWALCDGQTLPISQNTALFSIIGTYYGGNGVSTFQLPNLQGMIPLDQGQGNGLTDRALGETGGEPTVTLATATVPPHNHLVLGGTPNAATTSDPKGAFFTSGHWSTSGGKGAMTSYNNAGAPLTALHLGAILAEGGSGSGGAALPHNNIMPYQVVTFIIALNGQFPPRS
jgi:microcystin-dependent protein